MGKQVDLNELKNHKSGMYHPCCLGFNAAISPIHADSFFALSSSERILVERFG